MPFKEIIFPFKGVDIKRESKRGKERDTQGESKRGFASLIYPSPFPLIKGRGTKGDGVTK